MTQNVSGTPEKDTADWVTGDEPMTGPQASYLGTLAHEAGRELPEELTKAQASELIDELQQQTGRGVDDPTPVQSSESSPSSASTGSSSRSTP